MRSKLVISLIILGLFCPELLAQRGGSSSSSSSSRSYSSGSSSRSYSSGSSSRSSSASKPSTSSSSSGKNYSSGSSSKPAVSSSPGKSYSSGSSSSRPTQPSFDKLAREDKFKADNRAQYDRGTQSKNTYTTPSGQTKTINNSSTTINNTRNNITEEKWINRNTRITTTFNNYTVIGSHPTVVYHDPYNTFFWLWLLDRSVEDRAMWYYHHRADVDSRRLDELRRKDAEFDARLKKLEGKPVNANYSPTGIDEDLMYTDDYIDSVYNPAPKNYHGSSVTSWFGWACLWIFVGTIVVFFVYLIFLHRVY